MFVTINSSACIQNYVSERKWIENGNRTTVCATSLFAEEKGINYKKTNFVCFGVCQLFYQVSIIYLQYSNFTF